MATIQISKKFLTVNVRDKRPRMLRVSYENTYIIRIENPTYKLIKVQ